MGEKAFYCFGTGLAEGDGSETKGEKPIRLVIMRIQTSINRERKPSAAAGAVGRGRRLFAFLLTLLWTAGGVWTGGGFAQEIPAERKAPAANTLKNGVPTVRASAENGEKTTSNRKKNVRIDQGLTFWLFDNQGNWKIPLPNWSIEDVMRSIDSSEVQRNELPYTIQSMNAVGRAETGKIELTIEYRINTFGDAVVRVPLGLAEGVYIPDSEDEAENQAFRYTGPGRCYLDIDRQNGGYVAVIQTVKPKGGDRADAEKTEDSALKTVAYERTASDENPTNEDIAPAETTPETPSEEKPAETPAEENPAETPSEETPAEEKSAESLAGETSVERPEETPAENLPTKTPMEETPVEESVNLEEIPELMEESAETPSIWSETDRHTVTIRLEFKIDSPGSDEYQLKATFAPSVTSKVRLEVPISDVQMMTGEGVMALTPINLNETTSEITLSSVNRTGKPTELTWWKRRESRFSDVPKALQVEDGVISVSLDAQQVQYDVTLPIRCFGENSDQFRIRLPENTHLVRESVLVTGVGNNPIGIREVKESVSPAENGDAGEKKAGNDAAENETAGNESTVVEIRLAREAQETVTIQFKAMATSPAGETPGSASPVWELGGFELLGAQKQYGRIKVQRPKETNCNLTPAQGVRPSADPNAADGDESEYFTYFSQPFSLQAQAIVRQARISVNPEYQILVQQGRVRLSGRFQYTVHGAMVRQLRIKTADWLLSEAKPDNVIDVGKVYTDQQSGEMVLPLIVPSEGQIEIGLTAVRELTLNQELLELPIPVPIADWVEPAAVVIVPDDDVELIPAAERLVDLFPKGARALNLSIEIPRRQQSPLVYQVKQRTGGDTSPYPLFVSEIVFHEQKIEVVSETEAVLMNRPTDQIQQKLTYTIEHQPLKTVSLLAPEALKENSALTISVDGKPVPPMSVVTEPYGEAGSGLVRKRITFPDGARIGTCVVSLLYSGPNFELTPQMSNRIIIDLASPEDGTLLANRLKVETPPGVLIEQSAGSEEGWKPEEKESERSGANREYRFVSPQRENRIALRGILNAEDVLGTTVVERVWIQTWLAPAGRFDRVSCRVLSDQEFFQVELPKNVRREQLEIKLDDKPYFSNEGNERSARANTLTIRLDETQKGRPLILEIAYLMKPETGAVKDVFELPRFSGSSVWVRRCYWQVILPPTLHIIGGAEGWTPEYYDMTWSGFFFRRVASMGQDELGTWVGVAAGERIPGESNVYLFSSFNPPALSRLRMMDRALLILFGSGATLLFGLSFLYFPKIRYQGVLLFLALLFVAVFVYRPVVILIFLQTTVFGLVLALFALCLKRLLRRRTGEIVPMKEHSVSAEIITPPQEVSNTSGPSIWVDEKTGGE